MEVRKEYCKHCGSPMKMSVQRKNYDTYTGELIGKHYWNMCSRFRCRWFEMDTTFQRLYIREEDK